MKLIKSNLYPLIIREEFFMGWLEGKVKGKITQSVMGIALNYFFIRNINYCSVTYRYVYRKNKVINLCDALFPNKNP